MKKININNLNTKKQIVKILASLVFIFCFSFTSYASYTVNFNINPAEAGTLSFDTCELENSNYDRSYFPNIVLNEGYAFENYYSENGEIIVNTEITEEVSTVVIKCKKIEDEDIVIDFDSEGANLSYNRIVVSEKATLSEIEPNITLLEGYETGGGWYNEAGENIDLSSLITKSEKLTYKAEVISYDIQFYPQYFDERFYIEAKHNTKVYDILSYADDGFFYEECISPLAVMSGVEYDGLLYFDSSYQNIVPKDYIITKSEKFYIKMEKRLYDINFIATEGGTISQNKVTAELLTPFYEITPNALANNNYIFEGWFDEEGKKVNANYAISKNGTYKAKFEKIESDEFIVNINAMEGGSVYRNQIKAKKGIKFYEIKPITESDENYIFEGWYNEEGEEITSSYRIKGPETINAKFRQLESEEIKIKFLIPHHFKAEDFEEDFEKRNEKNLEEIYELIYKKGDILKDIYINNLTNGVFYDINLRAIRKVEESQTIYVLSIAGYETITINVENGGSVEWINKKVETGTKFVDIKPLINSDENYVFDGFYDEDNEKVADDYVITWEEAFTAKFKEKESDDIKIYFNTDGNGKVSNNEIAVKKGTKFCDIDIKAYPTLEVFYNNLYFYLGTSIPKDRYILEGFYNENGDKINNDYIFNESEVINVKFGEELEEDEILIKFKTNVEDVISFNYVAVNHGENFGNIKPDTITVDGMEFKGWYDYLGSKISDSYVLSCDETFEARYGYNVKFNATEGGTLSEYDLIASKGSSLKDILPIITTNEGYIFENFYDSKGKIINGSYLIEKNETINVKFRKVKEDEAVVSFFADEGGAVDFEKKAVAIGTEFSKIFPLVHSEKGYVFVGFYFEDDSAVEGTYTINKDENFYAKFRKISEESYIVKFAAKEGGRLEYTEKLVEDSTKFKDIKPDVYADEGYEFDWWTLDRCPVDDYMLLYKNEVVYANFNKLSYTISFYYVDSNGGELEGVSYKNNVEHGTKLIDIITNIPTYEGYVFDNIYLRDTDEVVSNNYEIKKAENFDIRFKKLDENEIVVKFETDTNGKVLRNEISVESGKTFIDIAPTTESNENYVFDAWYNASGSKVADDYVITKEETFIAKFREIKDDEIKINFETTNGGNINKNEATVKAGTVFSDLDIGISENEGYRLEGWYDIYETKISNEYTINYPQTFIANFVISKCKIKFTVNDVTMGSVSEIEKEIEYGSSFINTIPTTTANENYVFDNWYNESNEKVADGYVITKEETFTAKFKEKEKDEIVVKFNTDGNGKVERSEIAVENGKTFIEIAPTTESNDGYVFDAWYNESGNKVEDDYAITKEETFTAKFKAQEVEKIIIKFIKTEGGNINKNEIEVASGTKFSEINIEEVANTGYTFDGYYNKYDEKVADDYVITKEETFTAKFTKNNYTISFKTTDGGTISEATKKAEHGISFINIIPTITANENYVFDNWYNESNEKVSDNYVITKEEIFTAKFKELEKEEIVIKFNTDGNGKVARSEMAVKSGTTFIEIAPTTESNDGYVFDGWYNASNSKVADSYVITKEETFTAKFKEAEEAKIIIKFIKTEGGNINKNETEVASGTKFLEIDIEEVANTGYTFDGYYNKYDEKVADDYVITKEETFTVKFTKNKYIIEFLAEDGGIVAESTKSVEYGSLFIDIIPTTIANDGYVFDSFYKESGEKISDNYVITKEETFIAKFLVINDGEIVVEFAVSPSEAGTLSNYKSIAKKGISFIEVAPTTYSNENYVFDNYYNEDDEVVEGTYEINKSQKIIAKFKSLEDVKYIINFVVSPSDAGIISKNEVSLNSSSRFSIIKPTVLTNEGYDFIGFYNESDLKVLDSSLVNSSTTYTAKFEKKKYEISFIAENGGTINETSKTVEYGKELFDIKPEVTIDEGYIIDGYYNESGEKVNDNYKICKAEKFTIKFRKVESSEIVIKFEIEPIGGGIINDKEIAVEKGSKFADVKPTIKTNEGYIFEAFYGENENQIFDDYLLEKNETIKVKFIELEEDEFVVKFESEPSGGGSLSVNEIAVKKGSKFSDIKPSVTPDDIYMFDAFYNEENEIVSDDYILNNEETFKALFVKKEVVIRFECEEETAEIEYSDLTIPGKTIWGDFDKPYITIDERYEFDGWYNEKGEKVSEDYIILNDEKFIAKHKKTKLKITFETEEGGILNYSNILVDLGKKWSEIEKPIITVKPGYVLKGWYDGEKLVEDSYVINDDKIFIVKYEKYLNIYDSVKPVNAEAIINDEGNPIIKIKELRNNISYVLTDSNGKILYTLIPEDEEEIILNEDQGINLNTKYSLYEFADTNINIGTNIKYYDNKSDATNIYVPSFRDYKVEIDEEKLSNENRNVASISIYPTSESVEYALYKDGIMASEWTKGNGENVKFENIRVGSTYYVLTRKNSKITKEVDSVIYVRNKNVIPEAEKMYSVLVINGKANGEEMLKVKAGENITIETESNDFSHWESDIKGIVFGNKNNRRTTFTMPSENIIIYAKEREFYQNISIESSENGSTLIEAKALLTASNENEIIDNLITSAERELANSGFEIAYEVEYNKAGVSPEYIDDLKEKMDAEKIQLVASIKPTMGKYLDGVKINANEEIKLDDNISSEEFEQLFGRGIFDKVEGLEEYIDNSYNENVFIENEMQASTPSSIIEDIIEEIEKEEIIDIETSNENINIEESIEVIETMQIEVNTEEITEENTEIIPTANKFDEESEEEFEPEEDYENVEDDIEMEEEVEIETETEIEEEIYETIDKELAKELAEEIKIDEINIEDIVISGFTESLQNLDLDKIYKSLILFGTGSSDGLEYNTTIKLPEADIGKSNYKVFLVEDGELFEIDINQEYAVNGFITFGAEEGSEYIIVYEEVKTVVFINTSEGAKDKAGADELKEVGVKEGEKINSSDIPVLNDYTYLKTDYKNGRWMTKKGTGESEYQFDFDTVIDEDIVLYAYYDVETNEEFEKLAEKYSALKEEAKKLKTNEYIYDEEKENLDNLEKEIEEMFDKEDVVYDDLSQKITNYENEIKNLTQLANTREKEDVDKDDEDEEDSGDEEEEEDSGGSSGGGSSGGGSSGGGSSGGGSSGGGSSGGGSSGGSGIGSVVSGGVSVGYGPGGNYVGILDTNNTNLINNNMPKPLPATKSPKYTDNVYTGYSHARELKEGIDGSTIMMWNTEKNIYDLSFIKNDGTKIQNEWITIVRDFTDRNLGYEYATYRFDNQGNAYTGLYSEDKKVYYFSKDFDHTFASAKIGWSYDPFTDSGYYVDPLTGDVATGWRKIEGKVYYFNEPHNVSGMNTTTSVGGNIPSDYGKLYVNTITPDGYQVGDKGQALTLTDIPQRTNTNNTNNTNNQTQNNGGIFSFFVDLFGGKVNN